MTIPFLLKAEHSAATVYDPYPCPAYLAAPPTVLGEEGNVYGLLELVRNLTIRKLIKPI